MNVFLVLFFSSLIIDILCEVDELDICPESDQCPNPDPPTVDKGKIILTVFYDDDPDYITEKPDTDLIKIVCDALDAFGDELEAHFKVGAGIRRGEYINDPLFFCPYGNCAGECNDACAAKLIKFFPTQVCCHKRGGDFYKCAADQGLKKSTIETCVSTTDPNVCEEVLMGNLSLREEAKVPYCYLPLVLYNGKMDRCSQFKNSAEFIKILCRIYRAGNMKDLKPCNLRP